MISIFRQIALYPVLGKPLIMYGGLGTLILLLAAAVIAMMIMKGKRIPLAVHVWLARIAILAAILHGVLAMSIFF